MIRKAALGILFAGSAMMLLPGCGGDAASSPLVAELQPKLLLQDEPDGVQQVSELREALLPGSAAETKEPTNSGSATENADQLAVAGSEASPRDVVVMGVVGGMSNPFKESRPDFPFTKDAAVFYLADAGTVAEIEADGHVHADGEECAFCAAHAEDHSQMLALVQFRDEKGKVLSVDARDLFDLKEGETVVVQGAASVGAGETLIVDATGLYIRR